LGFSLAVYDSYAGVGAVPVAGIASAGTSSPGIVADCSVAGAGGLRVTVRHVDVIVVSNVRASRNARAYHIGRPRPCVADGSGTTAATAPAIMAGTATTVGNSHPGGGIVVVAGVTSPCASSLGVIGDAGVTSSGSLVRPVSER